MALGILALISASVVVLSAGSLSALVQGGDQTEAEALSQEALEAVRAIRDRAFNELNATSSGVTIGGANDGPASWWNTGYQYRRRITTTTGANSPEGGYQNYTVRFANFDTEALVDGGKMQSDCDDLRVAYWSGTENIEVNRHIIDCNATTTDVRFPLQADITASSTDGNYYVYYGAPNAPATTTDMNVVYLWWDDMTGDSSSDYTFGSCGGSIYDAWSYNSEDYFQIDTRDNGGGCFRRAVNERDAYIEAEWYHTSCQPINMVSGMLGRYTGTGSGGSESATQYYRSIRTHNPQCGGGYSSDGDILELGGTGIDGTNEAGIVEDQWRKQGFALWGINPTGATFWNADTIDGFGPLGWPSVGATASGNDADDSESAGDWGVFAHQDTSRVRNMLVRRYVDPEPVLTLADEAEANQWVLRGQGTTDTIGNFSRTIAFTPVCRDTAHDITACPGSYTDIHTLFMTATTSWSPRPGATNEVAQSSYITNWDSREWTQTDWDGGSGQTEWSSENQFSTSTDVVTATDGEATLAQGASTCGDNSWTFATSTNYTFDSGAIEVASSTARLVSSSGAINGIADSVTDTLEYDTANGKVPDILHISGDVYAVAYLGPDSDGFVETYTIGADGAITDTAIDTLEFDTAAGDTPDIIHVTGNHYAIAYQSSNDDGFIKTVTIDSSGNIGNTVTDTLEFDSGNGEYPSIVQVDTDTYAIAYNGPDDDGWLATVDIDSGGNIAGAVTDTLEFDTTKALYPAMVAVDGNTFAIAYEGDGDDGWLATVDIDTAGNISNAVNDSLEFDTGNGEEPDIIAIDSDTYAITYAGSGDDGFVKTYTINSAGAITDTAVDSLEFDTGNGRASQIAHVSGDIHMVAYTGASSDGYAALFDIDSSGTISNSVTDTLEYDTSHSWWPAIAQLSTTTYAIVYQGPSDDGFIKTIELTTSDSYPTDRPTITPTGGFLPPSVDSWIGFTETATKQSGAEIYYQLSPDGGATWQYWDGSAWTAATTSTNYNTASVVDANIWQFSVASSSVHFRAFLESDGSAQVSLDTVNIDCRNLQYEIGSVTTDETWASVTFNNTYEDPVVFTIYEEDNNTLPASPRIRNLSTTGADFRIQHPTSTNLVSDLIRYWVIEEGQWTLDDTLLEVRTFDTDTVGHNVNNANNWVADTVTYNRTFDAPPLIFHQVQTNNDSGWIVTWTSADGDRTNPPGTTTAQVALNGAEAVSSHGTETIGWMAIEANATGTIGTNTFETFRIPDNAGNVGGHDDGCNTTSYQLTYDSAPAAFAYIQEFDGGNGGWTVICSPGNTTEIGFHIEEDQVLDSERGHYAEITGYIAFDGDLTNSADTSFVSPGFLTSSAFDTGDDSPMQVIEWDETIPACTSRCDVELQIQTALDDNGSPGEWTGWSGPEGDDGDETDYFTSNTGELIHTDHNGDQWIRWRARLIGDNANTPTLTEVRINYK